MGLACACRPILVSASFCGAAIFGTKRRRRRLLVINGSARRENAWCALSNLKWPLAFTKTLTRAVPQDRDTRNVLRVTPAVRGPVKCVSSFRS